MVSKLPALNSSQISFLEQNFVVFDPDSGETYTDFSNLHQYQLILIGEQHHTIVLHQIQALFF